MKIGSLFSGYGGLDMAAQSVLGGELAWVSDIEPGPTAILAHHHPTVPNLGDITRANWTEVEPIDILTGGFPCQDVSTAGKRAGLTDGTRSGLWSYMRDAINTLRPSLVVAENVRGLLSARADSDVEPCPWCLGDDGGGGGPPVRALGAVLADLADIGYDAAWCGLRAADVGATHGRYRIFILAWPADPTGDTGRLQHGDGGTPADTDDLTACAPIFPTPRASDSNGAGHHGQGGPDLRTAILDLMPTSSAADALGGHERRGGARGDELLLKGMAKEGHLDRFGDYAPAITRWEAVTGRPAPEPTEPTGRDGAHRLSPAFVEWMMGLPEGHVTGVPDVSRTLQLRALGNGVVPQQGAEAIRRLLAIHAAQTGAAA